MRISYVNGQYVSHLDAAVHIDDRGYQFADGIYEVILIYKGALIDYTPHMDRMDYSLGQLGIQAPMSRASLFLVIQQLMRRNRVKDAVCYIQVSRGTALRNHAYQDDMIPNVVITLKRFFAKKPAGGAAITLPDERWGRPDIKSTSLLPNILAKRAAKDAGAIEAILYDDQEVVTEGSSSNVFIINAAGQLQTYPSTRSILTGITRKVILTLAKEAGLNCKEDPFTLSELRAAKEVFASSSTQGVTPILSIDGTKVGEGKVGSVSAKLQQAYFDRMDQLSVMENKANDSKTA